MPPSATTQQRAAAPTTARVILTFDCPRRCPYCCNTYRHILDQATTIKDLRPLAGFPHVCLTGGEPLLYPDLVRRTIAGLRNQNPAVVIYLYTAQFAPALAELLPLVDGLHCTLHAAATPNDVFAFIDFQELVANHPDKSCRLYLNPELTLPVPVRPSLWRRVEVKPWIAAADCQLPAHETLFRLNC